MADYEASVGLDGYSDAFATWNPAVGVSIPSNGARFCGAIFDLGLTLATGRTDLVLDPPTITELTFSSTVDVLLAPAARTYSVYLVNIPAIPDFASGGTDPSTYVVDGTAVFVEEVHSFIAPMPAGTTFDTDIPINLLYPVYRGGGWVGRIGIVFRLSEDAAPGNINALRSSLHVTTPEQLTTVELPFMLGRSGDVRARSRVDRCPICGFYDVRERFIPDGYREGTLVCKYCWDPQDPPSLPIPPDTPPIND